MITLMELFSCVIETLICYFYLNGVLDGKKLKTWKVAGCFGIFLIVNILRSHLFLPFQVNIAVSFVMCLGLALICFNGKENRKFYFAVIEIITIIVADMLTALTSSIFFNINYEGAEFTLRFIGMIMTNAFSFVIYTFVIYIAKKKYRQLTLKFNILMILCPLISIFLLMLLDVYIAQSPKPYYPLPVLAVLGLGYINIMVFNFFDYYEKGVRVTAMDAVVKANEENYKLLEANEIELHILRHDILRYVAIINELLIQDNIGEARQCFEELKEKVRKVTCFSRTGQLGLDTVLNVEGKKAVHAGIRYDLKLSIEEEIRISQMDLSQLLSNAIDNAIEACESMIEKYILVSVSVNNGEARMTIENASPEVKSDGADLKTTKDDTKRHGFGLQSMKEVVEKYDGIMSTGYNEHNFICRIEMKNIKKT